MYGKCFLWKENVAVKIRQHCEEEKDEEKEEGSLLRYVCSFQESLALGTLILLVTNKRPVSARSRVLVHYTHIYDNVSIKTVKINKNNLQTWNIFSSISSLPTS